MGTKITKVMHTTDALEHALALSIKIPTERLGFCLPMNLSQNDYQSLFKFLHDSIENQYYEHAPDAETQKFLDTINWCAKEHFKRL